MANSTSNDMIEKYKDNGIVKPTKDYLKNDADIGTNTNIDDWVNVKTAYINKKSKKNIQLNVDIKMEEKKKNNYNFNKK